MSRKINIQGIDKVRERLQKLKNLDNTEIAMAVAEKGKDLAQAKYNSGDVIVTAESIGKGKARIVASGEKVAFYEYGVGTQGEQSAYKGQLPTEPITFESAKETHTTQGWEYNYPNEKTKRNMGGSIGWFYGGKFTDGQSAQAQMWRTANELVGGEAEKAVEQFLKEKGV